MELKRVLAAAHLAAGIASNCTNMELKLVDVRREISGGALLIAPIWN